MPPRKIIPVAGTLMFVLNLKFFITLLWVSVAAKLLIIWGIGKNLASD